VFPSSSPQCLPHDRPRGTEERVVDSAWSCHFHPHSRAKASQVAEPSSKVWGTSSTHLGLSSHTKTPKLRKCLQLGEGLQAGRGAEPSCVTSKPCLFLPPAVTGGLLLLSAPPLSSCPTQPTPNLLVCLLHPLPSALGIPQPPSQVMARILAH
jgi:hypothetical protein